MKWMALAWAGAAMAVLADPTGAVDFEVDAPRQTGGQVVNAVDGDVFGRAVRLTNTEKNAMALAIDGSVLYGGAGNTIYTFDLTNPLRPAKLGEVRGIGGARQLAVQKGFVYVTTREYGLWVVDCRDPRRPRIRSRFDTCELATGVDVAGDVCFCGQRQNGVEFIDVSNPDDPRHIAMRRTRESQSVVYRDGWLYSGEWGGGFVTVFDVHDMRNIRQVALPELHGYGDGVWVQGHYLYAARGHHSLHREVKGGVVTAEMKAFGGPAVGGGMGHGLDIFDIADPRAPRRVGEVDYPPFYARGLDMWTPRTSGDLLVAAQTHNGLFAVDISDKSAPRVIGRWVRPSADHPEHPSQCVGSVAIGDGAVYAAVKGEGFFVIPCARAKREIFDRGVLPKNADYREAYPTDAKAWHVWKPETTGQARALAVTGDVVYAACGDAGLHVLKILPGNGGLREIGRLTGHDHVFDVKVSGGAVYAAEGQDGVGVYRLADATTFDEIARLPKIASGKSLALYVQTAAPGWVFCSDRRGVDLFDVRKLPEMRHVLHTGSCPGWDKYLQDAAVGDGRFIAYNNANTGVIWFDLKASPEPVVAAKTTPKNRLSLAAGLCAFRDGLTLASQGGGYVLLKPGEVDPPDGGQWRRRPLPPAFKGERFDGMPRSDGRLVVFTNRIRRRASLYDFADAENPKLMKAWKLSGNPDQAGFHAGKVLIPCGYQGVLLQKESAR